MLLQHPLLPRSQCLQLSKFKLSKHNTYRGRSDCNTKTQAAFCSFMHNLVTYSPSTAVKIDTNIAKIVPLTQIKGHFSLSMLTGHYGDCSPHRELSCQFNRTVDAITCSLNDKHGKQQIANMYLCSSSGRKTNAVWWTIPIVPAYITQQLFIVD